jgi:hypothetical protein
LASAALSAGGLDAAQATPPSAAKVRAKLRKLNVFCMPNSFDPG